MVKAGSTEKVVREIRRRTRRTFSAEEKIRIVLEGLRGEESLAALCRREGLAPNLYYRWSKEFLEAGKKRLLGDTTREATSTEVQDLRRENSQLKQVVAEAVLENRVLKKIWWSPVRGTIRATDRGREARDHPACGGFGSVGAPYACGSWGFTGPRSTRGIAATRPWARPGWSPGRRPPGATGTVSRCGSGTASWRPPWPIR